MISLHHNRVILQMNNTKVTITLADHNSTMKKSIVCDLLKVWEKSPIQSGIGFGFASHRLKNWREIFKTNSKPSNRVITFDSHLKATI